MNQKTVTLVSRKEWKAVKAKHEEPLTAVPSKLVVSNTNTAPCKTKEACIKAVQTLQRKHMNEQGLPDIQYNFLIGADGNIYEGRGWKVAGKRYPDIEGETIELAIIERYCSTDEEQSYHKEIFKKIASLMTYGIHSGHLDMKLDVVDNIMINQARSKLKYWIQFSIRCIAVLLVLCLCIYNKGRNEARS